jgi:hypothetical protein
MSCRRHDGDDVCYDKLVRVVVDITGTRVGEWKSLGTLAGLMGMSWNSSGNFTWETTHLQLIHLDEIWVHCSARG